MRQTVRALFFKIAFAMLTMTLGFQMSDVAWSQGTPPALGTPALAPTPDGRAAEAPVAQTIPNGGSAKPKLASVDERREWLLERFTRNVTSERTMEVVTQRVAKMTEKDVNRTFLREQKKVAKQAAAAAKADQAAADARSAAEQLRWQQALAFPVAPRAVVAPLAPAAPVALWPNVEWFPSGTQLGVGPNGGIGFGAQRVYPVPVGGYTPYYHPYDCTCDTCRVRVTRPRRRASNPPPANPPEVWYDGLRTRRGQPEAQRQ